MEYDFTALKVLTTPRQTPPDARTATKPAEARESLTTAEITPIEHILQRDRADIERARAVYKEYQQNIKAAGTLRNDIVKGIQRGEDQTALLLKAIKVISLMTGDPALLKQAEGDALTIYGYSMEQPEPLQTELGKLEKVIPKVKACTEKKDLHPDERKRAKHALEELEKRREYILKRIK